MAKFILSKWPYIFSALVATLNFLSPSLQAVEVAHKGTLEAVVIGIILAAFHTPAPSQKGN